MKVGLISFFLLFAPFTAARISDGFSIGLLDLMSFAFLALALPRISSVAKTGLGFLLTLLICTLTFSFLAGSIVNEFSARDLAFARMIFIMLPAILLISQPMSEEKVWRMTFLFFWGGFIAVLLGIVLHHLGIQIRSNQQALWAGDGSGPSLRAGGVLGNSSDFGHLTAVWGSVCGLGVLVFGRRRSRFLVTLLIFAVSFYATWIASSRAATLHLLLAYGLALPFLLGRTGWAMAGCATVFTLLSLPFLLSEFSLLLPQNVTYNLQRLDFLNISGNSTFMQTGRFVNWIHLMAVFQENWFLGIGYKNINSDYGVWGDNSYLTILVEFGLLAGAVNILLWIWLIAISAASALKNRRGVVFFAVVLSEAVHGLTVDTGTIWYSMPFAWLFITAHYLLQTQSGGLRNKRGAATARNLYPATPYT
ncbi:MULTISPECIES: O-antigen ligase family protein [Leisingera]|jgi:hypothetical protein|uniref:O-antigen ligase family protein n=1 Tax=Leisingera TaxID=191028 RepID=UPI00114E8AD8|nr:MULTISPECIES: hypothetical protein [Leisingera]QDI77696.1 hypothetical protein R2C4_18795 [Leisingera aquaemixtae]